MQSPSSSSQSLLYLLYVVGRGVGDVYVELVVGVGVNVVVDVVLVVVLVVVVVVVDVVGRMMSEPNTDTSSK